MLKNIASCLLATCALASTATWADTAPGTYPSHAVRLIVPAAPGSLTDPVARVVADEMTNRSGQTWVVDNRPGAGGIIGSVATTKAPADGYTLMLTANNFIITPGLYNNVPYDVQTDFTPIAMVGRADNLLVASTASGIKDINDLVTKAKASKTPLTYTSPLLGSAAHLTVELFKRNAGIQLEHIPYKDAGQGMSDTLTGTIPVNIMGIATAMQHIKTGKLVPLAWTGATRAAELPDVPTFVEAGFKDVHMGLWFALVGPAKLPPAITAAINQQVNAALATPAAQERLNTLRVDARASTPQALGQTIAGEFPVYMKLAADTGIKLD